MKNTCWLNPVQLVRQKMILTILAILATFIGAFLGVLTFGVPNIAYADYQDIVDDPNAIVNFNQLMLYPHDANLTNGVVTDSNVFNVGDKIYIYFHVTTTRAYDIYIQNDSTLINIGGGEFTRSGIYTMTSANAIGIYSNGGSMQVDYFNIINLTTMFGQNNDNLTLEQCQSLFVADYYNYNTGTAVSLSGLNSYAEGVQSVYDTLTYNYVGEDSYNLLESYAFYRGSIYYNGAPSKEQSHISVAALDGDGWTSGNGFALYYPFTSSLSAGDTITLNGMLGSATDLGTHQQATTYIIIRYGDNIYDVLNVNSIVLQDATINNVNSFTYTLPSDATGLVFYSLQPFRIKDFTIQVKSLSINNLIDNAYKNGVEKGSNAYQVGNNGYNAIYEAGRQQGIDDAGNYTFLGLISAVVDTPINAVLNMLDFDLLGVNMKAFYLSLFTFCIIVFIVKLII